MTTLAGIGLGSNLGDRHAMLECGLAGVGTLPETEVAAVSAFIETEPVGPPGQGPYLNAACLVRTGLSARELLDGLLEIERAHGRDRSRERRWGPRTLDLDLLLFGGEIIDEPGLRVPHPRLAERAFVLEPLCEIAPTVAVPGLGRTAAQLLEALRAQGA